MPDYIVDVSDEFFSQYDDQPKEIKKKFRKQLKLLKSNPKHYDLVNSQFGTVFVIPSKEGIQLFKHVMDSRFRGNDKLGDFLRNRQT